MGKLYVIGIGPGGLEHMTLKAKQAIEESNIVVGYNKYIDMIKPLVEDKELFSTGMRGEEARCRKALELSKENNTVALISTGDSGIYGMAGLILQMQEGESVEIIPGVTASSAAGSVIGAPLMHDNCNISLSDLMTPYDLIKKRVRNAADADMIISLYNPRSKGRPHYLREAIEIINEGILENKDEGFLYYNRACFYVCINKLDLALEDILKSIELNDFFEEYMKEDEDLDAIRKLEKYKEIFG